MTVQVQSHIHLDTEIGTAPENAPVLTWKTTRRSPIPVVFLAVDYTRKGYLRPAVVKDAGVPVQLTNFKYTLKVKGGDADETQEILDDLLAMLGKTVYLVDHNHPDDGDDHDDYVRTMFFSEMSEPKADHIKLDFYYVDVTLLDYSRA